MEELFKELKEIQKDPMIQKIADEIVDMTLKCDEREIIEFDNKLKRWLDISIKLIELNS